MTDIQTWKQKQEEIRKELITLVQGIAVHLEGFSLDDSNNYDSYTHLKHQDGRQLGIRFSQNRLEIRGHYKKEAPRHFGIIRYDEKAEDNITVSATRSPEAIAKDIKRRLLPSYTELWNQVNACVAKQEARHNKAAHYTQQLATLLGTKPDTVRENRHTVTFWEQNNYGSFETSDGENFSIKLSNVTFEEAKEIIRILKTI